MRFMNPWQLGSCMRLRRIRKQIWLMVSRNFSCSTGSMTYYSSWPTIAKGCWGRGGACRGWPKHRIFSLVLVHVGVYRSTGMVWRCRVSGTRTHREHLGFWFVRRHRVTEAWTPGYTVVIGVIDLYELAAEMEATSWGPFKLWQVTPY